LCSSCFLSFVTFLTCFFFSSRRRHTRSKRDWSSDVCSSDLQAIDTFGNVFASGVVERVAGMVSDATEEIRGKVQTLMNAIDNLIAFVNEPEIQAALISVRDGLNEIMDEIATTGLRDIDDLIDVVSKIRDLTDELTVALQQLQQRLYQETGGDGSTAGDLMDTLQIQESLNVVYSTMEDVLDSLNRVP